MSIQETSALSAQVRYLQEQLRRTQSELEGAQRDLEVQSHLTNILKQTADRLGKAQGVESVEALVSENLSLRKEKAHLLVLHGSLSLENKRLRSEAGAVYEERIRQLETEQEQLQAALNESSAAFQREHFARTDAETQIQRLTEQLDTASGTLGHEQEQRSAIEEENAALRQELKEAQEQIAALQAQLRPVQELPAENARLQTENADLQRTLRELGAQLKRLKVQNLQLREKLPPEPEEDTHAVT